MQRPIKTSVGALFAAAVLTALVFSSPLAVAQAGSGKFNPASEFPVGTQLTVSSINGVAAQRDSFDKPKFTQYQASIRVTAEVVNSTADGGIQLKILSGTITINGQTYSVSQGRGRVNPFDEMIVGGEASGPDGATYRWILRGFASMYSGEVLVGLRGSIVTIRSDNAILRYHLGFVATIAA